MLYTYPCYLFSVLFKPIFSFSVRLKDVQTLEELGDVYNHFLLYYGRDIPKMQNAAKAGKKRLKKIKEETEDGKMEVAQFASFINDDGWILHNCCVASACPVLMMNNRTNLDGLPPKGDEEELEVEEEEEQKGPDLKLASRRDMYSICQSVGLG